MVISSDQTWGPIVVLCKTKMDSLILVQSHHSDPDPVQNQAGSKFQIRIPIIRPDHGTHIK